MAESKHRVTFDITAQNRAKAAFDQVRGDMRQVEGSVLKLNRVLGTLGVGLSVGGLVAFAKSGIDAADALNKQSQSVGISVENLQAYQRAAKFAGVEGEQFNQSLARLAKGISDAAAGTGEAKDAFAALRVSVTSAGGGLKSTDEILLEVSDAFQKMENGTRKTGLAVDLFGQRIGPQLIPFLNQGRAGVAAAREELDRFGQLISTETAVAAEQFNDDLLRLKGTVDALKVSLASGALPALSRFTNELLAAQKATGGLLSGFFVQFASDTTNLQAELGKVDELLAKLKQQREDLAKPGFAMGLNRLLSSDLEDTERQIRAVETRRAFLLEIGKQRGFGVPTGDTGLPTPPLVPPPGIVDRERDAKFQNAIRALEQDALKIQEVTKFTEELFKIESGRYGKLSKAEKDRILDLAANIDQLRENARVEKEVDQAVEQHQKKLLELARAEASRLDSLTAQYKELADPLQKYADKLKEVQELQDKGRLTGEEAFAARAAVGKDLQAANDRLREVGQTIDKNTDAARDFGFAFSSALEDSIVRGEKLRDVMQGLVQDVARIALRTTVTEPLAAGVTKVVKGLDFGSIFGSTPTALQLSGPNQHGGSFMVGGSGGIDSTIVGFRATAGERVTVTPPGAHQGAGIVNHFTVDMRGASVEAVAELRRLVLQVNGSIESRAISAVADARLRGGSFAGAFTR